MMNSLEIIVWRIPHLVGDAVAISLIGMVLGPLYPIGINQAGRAIPAPLLSQAIGWIAAFATVGGALIPFITGALAGAAGVTAMQPL
jgi:fucose permease